MAIYDQQGKGSRLRTPFFSVMLNQTDVLTGVESFEVTNASHYAADTYKLTAAVQRLPPGLGPAYFGNSVGDELEIFAGVKNESGDGQPLSLIYGVVDDTGYNPVTQTLTL